MASHTFTDQGGRGKTGGADPAPLKRLLKPSMACAQAMFVSAIFAAAVAFGTDSGAPVPRFESLKASEANGRRGPALDQPALYRYVRAGLPLEIVAESGAWRRVRDPEGDESWMHTSLLSPRRTALVRGAGGVTLRAVPDAGARPRARLGPGVVAELAECRGGWRKLRVKGREGWARASELWGAPTCETGVALSP